MRRAQLNLLEWAADEGFGVRRRKAGHEVIEGNMKSGSMADKIGYFSSCCQ